MKKVFLLILLAGLITACQSTPTPSVEIAPAQTLVGATNTPSPALIPLPTQTICPPTGIPSTQVSTLAISPVPEYNDQFLQAIGVADESCLPDKTRDDVGVYIYDLTNERELVSINADTPFQFASAFKGPVLVYFLSTCKKYWDVESPEWNDYFRKPEFVKDQWFVSDEYKALIAPYISDVNNWQNMATFFTDNRVKGGGDDGPIDKRYFVLQQVHGMIARSSNPAAGDVLRFVYDHCQEETPQTIEERCGGSNAITEFNAWFNEFSNIIYQGDEPRRGLFSWDTVLEKDSNGKFIETVMSTNGLKDLCANQTAQLNCLEGRVTINDMTPRDFYRFYFVLSNLVDARVKATALNLLKVDVAGPARGNLKNMARNMGAEVMSKNGYGYYVYGSIIADAGIVQHRGASFIVVTLSFNAQTAMEALYGAYDTEGGLIGDPGLIQDMIEEKTK